MRIDQPVAFLQARHHTLDRLREIAAGHRVGAPACRQQRGFVGKIREVRPREPWGQARDCIEVDVRIDLHRL
jgi:hypothetical protein